MKKRIAIFQYDWQVASYIHVFIFKLQVLGFEVDFFYKPNQFIEKELFDLSLFKNTNIYYYKDDNQITQEVLDESIYTQEFAEIIDIKILNNSLKEIKKKIIFVL